MDYIIKKYDNDDVDDEPLPKKTKGLLWIISGKKRSGKTTLYLSALEHKQGYKGYFDNIFIISESAKYDDKLKNLVHNAEKQGKYYKELNSNNIESIKTYIKHEKSKLNKKEKANYHNLLILDDVITSVPLTKKKNAISDLFFNQRHYNLTIFLISQTFINIPPSIRKQADIISFFPTPNLKEVETLQNEYNIPDEYIEKCFKGNDHPFLHLNVVKLPIIYRKFTKLINYND
jgi:hypothetical protein